MKTVGIIGLGLMGGSIAKALSKTAKYKVVGCDQNKEVTKKALKDGVINAVWDSADRADFDITLLCLFPEAAENFLKSSVTLLKTNSILSDICGVKRNIVSIAETLCSENNVFFVGGHPMAGREKSGYENSTEGLFDNRYYILTKTENTNPLALAQMTELAKDIGCADVTITTPEQHDRLIAFTSQLPHLLAGAYIKSPNSDFHKGFSAGSYHDVSRVASVDENLWSQLFLQNGDNLVKEIDTLIDNLMAYRNAVLENNREALIKTIKKGRLLKERDITVNGTEKPHNFG